MTHVGVALCLVLMYYAFLITQVFQQQVYVSLQLHSFVFYQLTLVLCVRHLIVHQLVVSLNIRQFLTRSTVQFLLVSHRTLSILKICLC